MALKISDYLATKTNRTIFAHADFVYKISSINCRLQGSGAILQIEILARAKILTDYNILEVLLQFALNWTRPNV